MSNEQRTAARKKVASTLRDILEKRNSFLSYCGDKTEELKQFDSKSGFWADPADVTNKPPRWIVQLYMDGAAVKARLPNADGVKRLGFFNTASRPVGGIAVRVIPAIQLQNEQFDLHTDWEWLLFFGFSSPLRPGSSGQLVESFDPSTGTMRYMEQIQAYVAAKLFGLCDLQSTYVVNAASNLVITYEQASHALQSLIRPSIAPPTSVASFK